MRCQLFVLAALSLECAIAQPAHHRHHHKSRRGWQDVDFASKTDYDLKGVDFAKAYAEGQAAAAGAPAPAPADNHAPAPPQHNKAALGKEPKVIDVIPIPAESDTKESNKESKNDNGGPKKSDGQTSGSSSGSGVVPGATGGATGGHFGGRTAGKQGGNKDLYMGNVGVPFGSNMMLVDTATAQDKFKYTITFKNSASEKKQIIIWQNPGRNGTPLGGKGEDPVITIPLAPGASQAVAFDEDTHGAFSLDCDRGFDGSTTCARGEYNFGDLCPPQWDNPNGAQGWSGFSRSVIRGGTDEMSMSCLNCIARGADTDFMSKKGKNEFVTDKQLQAGGAIPKGPAHVLAEFA
ncbi:MAG: hypothetical protein LQ337_004502 [Flavoplaca oasis]|nr:MAG: hypothetical protein LQ337_004502 [Flavoplaca oasis]